MLDLVLDVLRFAVLAAVVLTLVQVVVEDLRRFRIRNASVLVLLALFPVWVALHWNAAALLAHLLFGLAMFLMLLAMYRFRLMGGGDVKLLAVAFLWLGHQASLIFTIAMAAATVVYVAAAKLRLLPARPSDKGYRIPFGPSIATAWILTILILRPL